VSSGKRKVNMLQLAKRSAVARKARGR
jgi:hypothetical protein